MKLIDEQVAVAVPDALVNERCGIVAHNRCDFAVKCGQQAYVFFPLYRGEFIADQTKGTDQAHPLLQVFFQFEDPTGFAIIQVTPGLRSLFDGRNGLLNRVHGRIGRF